MDKITITFDDAHAVNFAKLARLAEKAGKTLEEFVADFLNAQIVDALSRAEKGIRYPQEKAVAP